MLVRLVLVALLATFACLPNEVTFAYTPCKNQDRTCAKKGEVCLEKGKDWSKDCTPCCGHLACSGHRGQEWKCEGDSATTTTTTEKPCKKNPTSGCKNKDRCCAKKGEVCLKKGETWYKDCIPCCGGMGCGGSRGQENTCDGPE